MAILPPPFLVIFSLAAQYDGRVLTRSCIRVAGDDR